MVYQYTNNLWSIINSNTLPPTPYLLRLSSFPPLHLFRWRREGSCNLGTLHSDEPSSTAAAPPPRQRLHPRSPFATHPHAPWPWHGDPWLTLITPRSPLSMLLDKAPLPPVEATLHGRLATHLMLHGGSARKFGHLWGRKSSIGQWSQNWDMAWVWTLTWERENGGNVRMGLVLLGWYQQLGV